MPISHPRARCTRSVFAALGLAFVSLIGGVVEAGELHEAKAGKSTLYFQVPDWQGLEAVECTSPEMESWWTAHLGASSINLTIWLFPIATYKTDTPLKVAESAERTERDTSRPGGDASRKYDGKRTVPGPFGVGGYAVLCDGDIPNSEAKEGEQFVFCGVLDAHAYTIRVEARPALTEPNRRAVIKLLEEGVRAEYPAGKTKWTKEEIKRAWESSIEDEKVRASQKKAKTSKYHVLLTNAKGGKSLLKQMEKNFDRLHKTYPDGLKGKRRLLPLFYFARRNEFADFRLQFDAMDRDKALNMTGFAGKDFYATHAQSREVTHIRGATLQYFRARLGAEDGLPWFRHGAGWYMEVPEKELTPHARGRARGGSFMPFAELFAKKTLITSDMDTDLVLESASIIRFLRETEKDTDRFMEVIKKLGRASREDVEETKSILEKHFGSDLDAIQAEWVAFWKEQ